MIKFFRKIRQKLLHENKFSKYIIYAIGEIILVVIGILIALSINNWNEEAKNKRLEKDYLIRIEKDLESDIAEFNEAIRRANERNERVIFLQKAIDNPEVLVDSSDYFVQSIVYGGYTYLPPIANHSFEELKSSGRLSLIRNEKLRVSIAKYYDIVFSHTQWKYLREDVQLNYSHYIKGVLKQDQMKWVLNQYYAADPKESLSKNDVDDIFQRFNDKKEFHSFLPQVWADKYNDIKYWRWTLNLAQNLQLEIKSMDN